MGSVRHWFLMVCVAALLVGCAPSSPPPAASGQPAESGRAAPAAVRSVPKTLTIALQGEPRAIMTVLGGDVGGSPAGLSEDAVHQHLSTYNERGEVLPRLAAELPSQAQGTWTLRPDGTMQTIYRLRTDVTWHDGTPFTAKDVVFGWTVARDKELPVPASEAANLITSIETPDDHTVVLEWPRPYPNADIITDWSLGPLPVHLLEATYRSDKDHFQRLGYWSREFVGLGPYVMTEWEAGSHFIARAYDRFYAGRPKIDSVVFKFIPNEPTVVANLLSGTVDGQFRAVGYNQAVFVRDEWQKAGKQPVAIGQPLTSRMVEIQYREQYRDPKLRELADVRVRRGLLHAIDRVALIEHQYQGGAPVAHSFVSSDDFKWDWIKDVTERYDFDQRRALDLLAEGGWRRAPDGRILNSAGEQVTLQYRTPEGGQWVEEMAIVADDWKAIGFNVDQSVLPTAQSRDRMAVSTFPSVYAGNKSLNMLNVLRAYYGPECASEANRWAGLNSACYQNPEADRLIGPLLSAIDRNEQQRLTRDLGAIYSRDLPSLPLYYTVQILLFRDGVTGIRGGARPTGSNTWNIHEWDVVR
jgi:peptide/nickel transport system substrate-binding protein